MKKLYGVGINDADYLTREHLKIDGKWKVEWCCPYYRVWSNMLQRCYSETYHKKFPTYVGCTIAEEWKTFSNFKSWMEVQDWKDKQLDKDLLVEGNKGYGPNTCVFVTGAVNLFMTDCGATRGNLPIGVSRNGGNYMARCRNPFTKKREYLGTFSCPEGAYLAWKARKAEHAARLAEEQTDERVKKALIERYTMPE